MATPSPCSPGNPLIKLGDPSKAPTLDYNMPQEACYTAVAAMTIPIPPVVFLPKVKEVPKDSKFARLAALSETEKLNLLRNDLITGGSEALMGSELLNDTKQAIKVKQVIETVPVKPAPPADLLIPTESDPVAAVLATGINDIQPVLTNPQPGSLATSSSQEIEIAGVPLSYMLAQLQKGLVPRIYKKFGGSLAIEFLAVPTTPTPTITLIETYKICSFLGNYGAGKVVQTFTLLPGEKTQITIKSFKNQSASENTTASSSLTNTAASATAAAVSSSNTSVKTKSENVLDSFSQSAADELEDLVREETDSTESSGSSASSSNTSGSTTTTTPKNYSGGFKIGVGKFSIGGNLTTTGGTGGTTNNQTTNGYTSNSARSASVGSLRSALSKHVAQSSANREMEVNSTSGSNQTAGSSAQNSASTGSVSTNQQTTNNTQALVTQDENLTLRELQNINLSRVLNFVFRQMQQEYTTIIYLDDVRVGFSNGYPEQDQMVRLPDLDRLLNQVLDPSQVQGVKDNIARQLCNVYDYRGQKVSFAEVASESYSDCGTNANPTTLTYLRKRTSLGVREPNQAGNTEDTYGNITVPGVILSVDSHILRTDSLIVDAVLGQGEALDCYNTSLQQAAIRKAELENERYGLEVSRLELERNKVEYEEKRFQYAMEIIKGLPQEQQGAALQSLLNPCCPPNLTIGTTKV